MDAARQTAAAWQLLCDLDGRYRWYASDRMPTRLAAPTPQQAVELLQAHVHQHWPFCTLHLEPLRAAENIDFPGFQK